MVIDNKQELQTKEYLQRLDIKTMKKDIQRLRDADTLAETERIVVTKTAKNEYGPKQNSQPENTVKKQNPQGKLSSIIEAEKSALSEEQKQEMEKQRWAIEKDIANIENKINNIDQDHKKFKEEENTLKEKIATIDNSLKNIHSSVKKIADQEI